MNNTERISEGIKPLINFLENKETKKEVTSVIENSLKVISNAIPALIEDGVFQEVSNTVSDGLETAYTKLSEYFDAVQETIELTAEAIESEKKKFALRHPGKTIKIISAWTKVKKSVEKLGEAAYVASEHVSTEYKDSVKASNEEMKNPAEAAAEEMKKAADDIAHKHGITGTGFIGGF